MKLTYIVPVHVDDEYVEDHPTHARITFSERLLKRVKKLRAAVKKLDAYCIEDWNYEPEMLYSENDDGSDAKDWEPSGNGGWPDTMRLQVDANDIQWVWYIKHTNIQCSTEGISFKEINENLKVLKVSKTDLPKWAVSEKLRYPSSRTLVERRLCLQGDN